MLHQFPLRHRCARARDHGRSNVLAEGRMRQRKNNRIRDRRVGIQRLLDVERRDFLTADIDEFVQASREVEVTVRIQLPGVATMVPARNRIDDRPALAARIRRRNVVPAKGDFTVEDCDFATHRPPDRAEPVRRRQIECAQWRLRRSIGL